MSGNKPGQPGGSHGERDTEKAAAPEGLDERRRRLAAELAERRTGGSGSEDERTTRPAGIAEALKLSSEFIGGVIVGIAFGWVFDRVLGTSPWGLIVFLLLGFAAGVLNVLRSAGMAPQGFLTRSSDDRDRDKKTGPEGPER